ncbi:MAG: ATP-binding cassette domain-containing protein [Thermotogae bacterium]|nr:ATP-binding cassette domain-containing protein [Thermotogota bacterium]
MREREERKEERLVALVLDSISLRRNNSWIVRNVTLRFDRGKAYAILGNNGVGKTTIVNMIMGLEGYREHEGRIFLDGEDITALPVHQRARKGITLLWQEPARFQGLRVIEYLTLGGKLAVNPRILEDVLKAVGLNASYLEREIDESLSGGERKRIELASVLLLKPRYAMLDEPDSGIDLMSTEMIRDVFHRLKAAGSTVIAVTHREEIALLTDKAFLVCSGMVIKEGLPMEVCEYYKTLCDWCDHVNKPEEARMG